MSRGREGKRVWGDNGWEEWGGYMNAKKQKLADQFTSDTPRNIEIAGDGTGSHIFQGVSIHVNGYTVPSSDELKRLMMLHGGIYHQYYSKIKVTHVIATNLPYAKIKELRKERIVKPEWILDSIKEGTLLPDAPYQLYQNRTTSQGMLQFTALKEASPSKINTAEQNKQDVQEMDLSITNSSMVQCAYTGTGDKAQISVPVVPEPGSPQGSSIQVCTPISQVSVARGSVSRSPAKAGDANFVSEFYNNSRLHHISTWGAEFKAFVNELHSHGDTSFLGRERLRRLREDQSDPQKDFQETQVSASSEGSTTERLESHNFPSRKTVGDRTEKSKRVIMHVDMDCFFVSVGIRNRPDLVGKPVAVTHSKGKGMPEMNQEIRNYEEAYYSKRYKKDGEGLQTRHIKLAKSSLEKNEHQNTSDFEDKGLTDAQSLSKEPSTEHHPSLQSCNPITDKSLTGTEAPRKLHRPQPEPFTSMAEIASCSYEARQAGVKNGMFMGEARKRCPDLQTISYDFEGYKEVSQALYKTIASYTHDIEAVSCDEMFVDVSSIIEDTGVTPLDLARVLRQEIKEKTQCNASVGLASNILLARMSTRKAKPNGQFYLESGEVSEFLKQQRIGDLPGVGWSTGTRLKTMGVDTCGDLQNFSLGSLQKEFGPKTGQSLYSYCRGIDDRPIRVERERKSVSAEINYGIRFTQKSEADNFVCELATEVHKRLTSIQMLGKTVTLKLKVRQAGAPKETAKFMGHGICDNFAKSTTLAQPTDQLHIIQQESKALLVQMRVDVTDLRGMGIQISRLTSANTSTSTASNNKSLLDFVKPLPKTTAIDVPSTSVRPAMGAKAGKERSGGTILDFVSKQKSAVPTQVNRTPHLPEPKKTPLPPLPTLHPVSPVPSRAAKGADTPQEVFCLPSPSQLDPSVLAALPDDMRESIKKTYQVRKQQPSSKIQPVSTLSSSSELSEKPRTDSSQFSSVYSEANSSTSSVRGNVNDKDNLYSRKDQNRNDTTETHSKEESENALQSDTLTSTYPLRKATDIETSIWDQPSTSNGTVHINTVQGQAGSNHSKHRYDPSVLKELPPDILQEIMQQQNTGYLREDEKLPATVAKEDEDILGPVEPLPSISQVDPSCLEALPIELKHELQLAYQREQKTSHDSLPPTTAPATGPKSSPFKLHHRRGRPRKASPQKGTRQGLKASTAGIDILEMVTGVKSSPAKKTKNATSPVVDSKANNSRYHDNSEKDDSKPKAVNLCGAVALWDVKALLKEWTTSVEEPGNEDINHLVLYLNNLVLDRNLEMTDLVLRAMKRLASQMESTSPWRDAYQMIEDRVQDTVTQIYHSKLKIM